MKPNWLIGLAILIVAGAGLYWWQSARDTGPGPGTGDVTILEDRVLGDPAAPVTVIEYASLTCPHCADFHRDVLPRIKSAFIDHGRVKLIVRDYPLDGQALYAAVLTRCAPAATYHDLLDVLFATQEEWGELEDPRPALSAIGREAGMSAVEIETCFADEALINGVLLMLQEADAEYDIEGTPTFIINGGKFDAFPSFENLSAAIERALP